MENNFNFAEERERYALKQVVDRFTEDNNFTYEVKFNPPGNMNNYDLLILKYKDGKIVKRYLIESKIRFKEYDTYIIESKKIRANSLPKKWTHTFKIGLAGYREMPAEWQLKVSTARVTSEKI